jgi:hypothetical protein
MADKIEGVLEILGLWLIAVLGILGLPQYFPSPLGIQLSIIITATAAIGIILFLYRTQTQGTPISDREREDFRNGVATEMYSILKKFIDPLNHGDISHDIWSSKAQQSRAAILGKEDYLVLRSFYDAIDERNNYFAGRHGGFSVPTVMPLNRRCVEALSRAYSEVTWLKIASDTDSLLLKARKGVDLP